MVSLQAGAEDEGEEEEDDETSHKPTTPVTPSRATSVSVEAVVVAALVEHVSGMFDCDVVRAYYLLRTRLLSALTCSIVLRYCSVMVLEVL